METICIRCGCRCRWCGEEQEIYEWEFLSISISIFHFLIAFLNAFLPFLWFYQYLPIIHFLHFDCKEDVSSETRAPAYINTHGVSIIISIHTYDGIVLIIKLNERISVVCCVCRNGIPITTSHHKRMDVKGMRMKMHTNWDKKSPFTIGTRVSCHFESIAAEI